MHRLSYLHIWITRLLTRVHNIKSKIMNFYFYNKQQIQTKGVNGDIEKLLHGFFIYALRQSLAVLLFIILFNFTFFTICYDLYSYLQSNDPSTYLPHFYKKPLFCLSLISI